MPTPKTIENLPRPVATPRGAVCRVRARMPTHHGEAEIHVYEADYEPGEHIALVFGEVAGGHDVLVRIHSECFTGDILGSSRCDCGHQLERALADIAREGRGALLYLRQEGRGIGLSRKLEAYNLQDQGHDTVTANLLLGRGADERDYRIAVEILADLDVRSIRLLTNNPDKIDGLRARGMTQVVRVAHPPALTHHNARYLEAKASRMRHLFDVDALRMPAARPAQLADSPDLDAVMTTLALPGHVASRPFVTASYAQSLDGSIATATRQAIALSGQPSLVLTHKLRAAHDAILVGIGTVLADDPRLDVRLADGASPQVVIADSHLRTPVNARVFSHGNARPWIFTTERADDARARCLAQRGARVIRVAEHTSGGVDLAAMLRDLHEAGIRSVMVEGGARILTSFVRDALVDHLLVTVSPRLVGGLSAVSALGPATAPRLCQPRYFCIGDDMIVSGRPDWQSADPRQ